MMKNKKLFVPMVLLLLLAFNVSPTLAAKKTWNIEYTLPGSIYDRDSGYRSGGTLSLTVSGKVVGTPDYEEEQSVVDEPIYYGYEMEGEYDYWEDDTHYLVKYYYAVRIEGVGSYYEYYGRWYSPQPTFNGKLVVIWYDGLTASFNVDLSPIMIEKFTREGSAHLTYSYFSSETLYEWDEVEGNWILVEEAVTDDSFDSDFTYTESNIHCLFSGKIQNKGRPPLKGTLELWEVVSGNYIWGEGTFGPYQLAISQYAPIPPPV